MTNIVTIVENQRRFFSTNMTKNLSFRIQTLKKISNWIESNEASIAKALKEDLDKTAPEAFMCEIGFILSALAHQISHIRRWSRKRVLQAPLSQFPSICYTSPEPYGLVLVMAPWNYPFLLCLEPAIGAIAAGNCVLIKPSAYAPATAAIVERLVNECCDPGHVSVILGGHEENEKLLQQPFDYIFFTGSPHVGRIVMERASRHLTPVTLELGGKSPCLIEKSADVTLAARRIAFGKFINAGQTCVAPDYVLIPHGLKPAFIEALRRAIEGFFGDSPLNSKDLASIINEKHFQRLTALLQDQNLIMGGESDPQTLKIAPTVVDHVSEDNPLMQEEIFGPILPIVTYSDLDETIDQIRRRDKPLALYLFTKKKNVETQVLASCSFGGGCINDTLVHLTSPKLPFGGVGKSGMGSYHGYHSFQTFSHVRGLLKKFTWLDLPFRYYPLTKRKEKILRHFMK